MKITKVVLDSGKKIIHVKWSGCERKLPLWVIYLKIRFIFGLRKFLNAEF